MAHTAFRRSALLTAFDLAIRFNYTRIKNLQHTAVLAMFRFYQIDQVFLSLHGAWKLGRRVQAASLYFCREPAKVTRRNSGRRAESSGRRRGFSRFQTLPLPTGYCPLFNKRRSISLPFRSKQTIDLGGALRLNSSPAIFTLLFVCLSLSLSSVTIRRPS